jgi:hypothetical protein
MIDPVRVILLTEEELSRAEYGKLHGISVNCLEKVTPAEQLNAPIAYLNGRHDKQSPPAETRHL